MRKEARRRALRRQIGRLDRQIAERRSLSDRLSWIRFSLFAVGVVVSATLFFTRGPFAFLLSVLLFAVLFFIVVLRHRRVDESLSRHLLWKGRQETQIARMRLEWEALPVSPWTPRASHPFEMDLDIVGERSLHRLLDSAVTLEGSQRLREWLTAGQPSHDRIERRQKIVEELVPRVLFRDRLYMRGSLASGVDERWEATRLLTFFKEHPPDPWRLRLLIAGTVLAGANLLLLALDLFAGLPSLWLTTGLLYAVLYASQLPGVGPLFDEAMDLQNLLKRLIAVFQLLERSTFPGAPHLRDLCAPFLDEERRPSRYLRQVARVVHATGLRGNPLMLLLLNTFVPWDLYFAYRLDQHKRALSERLPAWLERWWEMEALASLANLAYLNPHYTLPHISGAPGHATFEARRLGHPMIPDAEKVTNDFSAGGPGQITLITGSNMAGKSSFLKTVGVNLALAYAGGPVDAGMLRASLFRLYACMRVSDSVTDGISYFYAEVKCLRALLDALEAPHPFPLFYFIDEIFRGTNNRERLIGSRAYIRALARSRGIGLISTHDLELVTLEEEIESVRNFHFREQIEAGRMVFDYTLRPGPCPTTNALVIMEMEGLPVNAESGAGAP